MNRRQFLRTLASTAAVAESQRSLLASALVANEPFVVKPYLQLGDNPRNAAPESLVVMWHTEDLAATWKIAVRNPGDSAWRVLAPPDSKPIAVGGVAPHAVLTACLTGLVPGSPFDYRILKNGEEVFRATGRARKSRGQSLRIIVEGDTAFGGNNDGTREDTSAECSVVNEVAKFNPDLLVVPGDLVYLRGRISEYRKFFFPVYNADRASPSAGAPLIRSVPFVAGLGQHDLGMHSKGELVELPDLLAYFLYLSMPLNGPEIPPGDDNRFDLLATPKQRNDFLTAAGGSFPQMGNFSFDYGDTHWTVLDSWNPNLDWNSPRFRDWLEADLAQAGAARWKFVACYLPPFCSSKQFPHVQKMRIAADLFEKGGVDMVFSGYVHCFERSRPLKFRLATPPTGPVRAPETVLDGEFELDREFDGKQVMKPKGPIYILTGAGGGQLHDAPLGHVPAAWLPFTVKHVSDRYSFSVLDLKGDELTFRQIAADGTELDNITIRK